MNPTPRRGKSLKESPLRPKEISSCQDTLGQIRAADSTAGRSATQQLEKCSVITAAALAASDPRVCTDPECVYA